MPSATRPASWSLRAGACALCVLGALVIYGASAPVAAAATLGGSGALSELTEAPTETTTTATTATPATKTEATNSKSVVLVVLAVAVLLLSGIAFVIVRDARRVAPASDADLIEERSAHNSAARLRKRRAKAKAARQQRKRNR